MLLSCHSKKVDSFSFDKLSVFVTIKFKKFSVLVFSLFNVLSVLKLSSLVVPLINANGVLLGMVEIFYNYYDYATAFGTELT